MVRLNPGACTLAVGIALLLAPSLAAQPAADEALFRKNCQTCHSLVAGDVQRAGPSLDRIFGRKVGALAGFHYSQALKDADFAWTAEALDAWLTDPQGYLPGTYMLYRQSDPQVRGAIIRYLEAQ
jgi:cytochrome c